MPCGSFKAGKQAARAQDHGQRSTVEDAETGYHMVSAYSSDFRPKPEGLQKIYSMPVPNQSQARDGEASETILDSTFIQRIQSSGY